MKTIIGKQKALEFANENNCNNTYVIEGYSDLEYHTNLNVPGFCRVVHVFVFESYNENGTIKWSFHHDAYRLLIEDTGEMFSIAKRSSCGNYLLGMSDPVPDHGRATHFRPSMAMPQKIGKATKSKILAWIDYLHITNTEKADYLNRMKYHNSAFAKRFRDKFGNDYQETVEYDGWISKFEVKYGCFLFTYTASEMGFIRTYKVDCKKIPTTEEMLA